MLKQQVQLHRQITNIAADVLGRLVGQAEIDRTVYLSVHLPHRPTLSPYTTLFRSSDSSCRRKAIVAHNARQRIHRLDRVLAREVADVSDYFRADRKRDGQGRRLCPGLGSFVSRGGSPCSSSRSSSTARSPISRRTSSGVS